MGDLREALKKRGGAYVRPSSTCSAPGGLSRNTSGPTFSSFLGDAFGGALGALGGENEKWQQKTEELKCGLKSSFTWLGDLANGTINDKDQSRPSSQAGKNKRNGVRKDNPFAQRKEDPFKREARNALQARLQSRGGVLLQKDSTDDVLEHVKEEVEPFLDSMEMEAVRRLNGEDGRHECGEVVPDDMNDASRDCTNTVEGEEVGNDCNSIDVKDEGDVGSAECRTDKDQVEVIESISDSVTSPKVEVGQPAVLPKSNANELLNRFRERGLASRDETCFTAPQAPQSSARHRHSVCGIVTREGAGRGEASEARNAGSNFWAQRELWTKRSAVQGSKTLGTEKRMTIDEAQAKIQRLAGSDLDELRRLRRLIQELSLESSTA